MPPQSQTQPGPEPERARRAERRQSGRAQRRAAEEQAARRRPFLLVGGAVAAEHVVALVLIFANRPQSGGAPILAADPLPASIPAEGRVMGQPDAPVTVVEWGDYTCPHCGAFTREVKPTLVSDYVAPGKVRFEFRDYAFLGPQATRAAEAASCAADQGKFWQFHDTLYRNQSSAPGFTDARLQQIAATLGLDTAAFNSCLSSGDKAQVVEQSNADAEKQGINSTPSFFVDGKKIDWQGWDSLKQAIDAELAKKS
jgi:protein-disulfide isomerase